jgi:hypothetical protein
MRYKKIGGSTPALGQQRSFVDVRHRSAYTPRAAQQRTFRHFAFVPNSDIDHITLVGNQREFSGAVLSSR